MSNYIPIKNLALDDRPREKLLQHGRTSLSNAEILAILIGSGNKDKSAIQLSQDILRDSNNNINILAKKNFSDLTQFKGIGEAKAISIIAALELGRRRKDTEIDSFPVIKSSVTAYQFIKHIFEDLSHEEFHVIILNRANKILKSIFISRGGISQTTVDGKIIFKNALLNNASALILCHNHPSGTLKPSQSDITLTKKLVDFSKLIDITILDHLIITDNDYFSFADNNMIS